MRTYNIFSYVRLESHDVIRSVSATAEDDLDGLIANVSSHVAVFLAVDGDTVRMGWVGLGLGL